MKKLLIKIREWLKKLLRKSDFDNKLFQKGVDEVKKVVKKELKKFEVVTCDRFYEVFVKEVVEKFRNIPVVYSFVNKAFKEIYDKRTACETILSKNLNKRIDEMAKDLVEWYNKQF